MNEVEKTRELVIASGKGGTGKTSLVAAFASLQQDAVLADCDVDAANLHLLLQPHILRREEFRSGHVARIHQDACTGCGECLNLCRFDAVINKEPGHAGAEGLFSIDEAACEGCGVCAYYCPENAIEMKESVSGEWFVSRTRYGPLVHAKLGIAAENSGKLVTQIRNEARALAAEKNLGLIIIDGSPGIGCPVIASITGCDMVLAVTEPTPSGLHDLERIADLAVHFRIPVAVAVNKFDLNESMTDEIHRFCEKRGFNAVGKIPYCRDFTEAMVAGQTIMEHGNGPASEAVRAIWNETKRLFINEQEPNNER